MRHGMRHGTPQEHDPPDIDLVLVVVLASIQDVLNEAEQHLTEDLALRLFALRSVIHRLQEARHP